MRVVLVRSRIGNACSFGANAQETLRAAKVCPAFFETNRSTSLAFSELWCTAEYPDGNKKLFHTASRGQQQHAEQQVIQRLQQHTERTTLEPRIVHLYMNVSPCSECAEALLSYKAAHPHTIITIKFTSLFAHHATNHRRGLQRMAECGIKLAVFDDRDWDDLTSVIHKDTGDSGNLPQGSTNKKSRTHEENDSETYSARKKLKV
ncbi:DNA dC-_dU-editing enzyme APOBEC-3H-like [Anabrus simplex]|uniref:DNA dC->dU-editing enzyme APOBEC-3H-like n=1 Tax=Anabrus simplex TaxID=316456 RepID=UPI0035A317B0